MAHIFISYSSKHRDLTEKLAKLLVDEGYDVWWDYALESWGSYQTQIDAALAAAAVIVVIWSPGAAASVYVKAEANKALTAGKLVNARAPDFPVSAVPTPYNALHIDILNLAEPHRLLRSICGAWTGKPHATAKPLHEFYEEAFGVSLFDTKRVPLDRQTSEIGPAELLQAKREAVPYIDATGIAEEMLAWCRDSTRVTAGRLIHGPGGFGKTRLMIETARRLRAEHWLAGFLQLPRRLGDVQEERQREQALEQVFSFGDEPGVLMVVEYAEGRQPEVEKLVKLAAARPYSGVRPVRLVLLARGDSWWRDFYEQKDGVETVFYARGTVHGDVRALEPIPAGEARLNFFHKTVSAFKPIMAAVAQAGTFPGWSGEPLSPERQIRLSSEPGYACPLAVQMEAILYLASSPQESSTTGIDALLDKVLNLERTHWRKLLGPLDDDRTRDMNRAVAQVTAVQGVDGRESAERLLIADGFYKGARTARVHVDPILRDLTRVYGRANGGIAHLEPDLIGEHHVVSKDAGDIELIESCLRWIEGEPEAERGKRRRDLIAVVQRATRPEHGVQAVAQACCIIDHIVRNHGAALAADILAVGVETAGALLGRIQTQIPFLDESALAALSAALPQESLALMDIALAVAKKRVDLARELLADANKSAGLAPEQRTTMLSRVAARLNYFSVRLADVGRREEALTAAQEAVDIHRRLTKDDANTFLPKLATSLNNLGNRLGRVHRYKEALAALQESVGIRRQLAKEQPVAFLSALASSLNNLSIPHARLGHRRRALAAVQESLDIIRRLAKERPDAFLNDLAMRLHNISNDLSSLGRWKKALAAAQEAVDIRRRLAKEQPDAFLSALASSLNNLSRHLYTLGRHTEAFVALQEVVNIRRQLAKERPDSFLPDLARSLSRMADVFAEHQLYSDAAATAQEALATLTPCLERDPKTYARFARLLRLDVLRFCAAAGIETDRELLLRVARALGREGGIGDQLADALARTLFMPLWLLHIWILEKISDR